ncbi:hypothetical protein [Paenibacillus sp. DMB20]|nr:hypothetical protein [Paenibacillus sp. DMB20]
MPHSSRASSQVKIIAPKLPRQLDSVSAQDNPLMDDVLLSNSG